MLNIIKTKLAKNNEDAAAKRSQSFENNNKQVNYHIRLVAVNSSQPASKQLKLNQHLLNEVF